MPTSLHMLAEKDNDFSGCPSEIGQPSDIEDRRFVPWLQRCASSASSTRSDVKCASAADPRRASQNPGTRIREQRYTRGNYTSERPCSLHPAGTTHIR